ETRHGQTLRNLLGRPLQRDVNDCRAWRSVMQPLQQAQVTVRLADRRRLQLQVRAVKAGHDGTFERNVEGATDVANNGWGGRRGQRQYALDAKLARGFGQLQIVGAKVVAPLGDAVCFVHGEQCDAGAVQVRQEALVVEALGRDVEQLKGSRAELLADLAQLSRAQRGVQPGQPAAAA